MKEGWMKTDEGWVKDEWRMMKDDDVDVDVLMTDGQNLWM